MQQSIQIKTAYITLGQLLKEANVIETGGMAKWFLEEHNVVVNDMSESRRGRKLYPGDCVSIEGIGSFVVTR